MPTDTTTPAWMLDVAESVLAGRRNLLCSAMALRGENEDNYPLFRLRARQLDELLAGGRVLAVEHAEPGAARFADFYSVRYGDVGSGGRALIVETDEPMEIRPVTDRQVIVKRAWDA